MVAKSFVAVSKGVEGGRLSVTIHAVGGSFTRTCYLEAGYGVTFTRFLKRFLVDSGKVKVWTARPYFEPSSLIARASFGTAVLTSTVKQLGSEIAIDRIVWFRHIVWTAIL